MRDLPTDTKTHGRDALPRVRSITSDAPRNPTPLSAPAPGRAAAHPYRLILLLALVLGLSSPSSSAAASKKNLVEDFCLGCHDTENEKGDFNLEVPLYDQPVHKNPALWSEVIKRLAAGEMPPEDANQPSDEERQQLIAWLKTATRQGAAQPADRISDKPAAKSAAKSKQFTDIPIVDTHIHLYDPRRPGGVAWPPPDDKVLYRPILPKDFNKVAGENNITATVIVEASDRVEDNQWILDLVKGQPKRYIGVVGNLPIGTPEFAGHLKCFSKDKRYVGIRMRQRPGDDEFFTEAVWRDLRLMASRDLTLDVLLANFSLEDIDLIARKVPNLKILINHVTGLIIEGKPADPDWVKAVQKAASHPNVHCKVSGLFQRSNQQPAPKDLTYYKPILDVVYDAFGEDRIIYGSNWPVSLRGGTYAEYKAIIFEHFSPKGRPVMEKLLYRNALKFYGLPDLKKKDAAKTPRQGQGYNQANTMGAGAAPISKTGKFRVFILAGQSNMTGQGQAKELNAPFNQPHERIRIWANKRWQYLVPKKNFGPDVAMAHQLAEHWPNDTIGIIKVAIGGTGILSFQPDWTFESAQRTKDGRKGNLYRDITDAVQAARKVSDFKLAGFAWKQGGKDMRSAELADEYLANFEKMIITLRKDLDAPDLPSFIAAYVTRQEYENYSGPISRNRPGMAGVIKAQLDAVDKIPNVVTFAHGKLPCRPDKIHFNTEGQLKLGRMFADAIEKYQAR
jgi:predicted TIM-barrel fold metal-dependent hydrolase